VHRKKKSPGKEQAGHLPAVAAVEAVAAAVTTQIQKCKIKLMDQLKVLEIQMTVIMI